MNYYQSSTVVFSKSRMPIGLVSSDEWDLIIDELNFSVRESEVIQGVFDQLSRKQIAERLGLKERTVRQYLENIHIKLHVNTRIGVVLRVIQIRDTLHKKAK